VRRTIPLAHSNEDRSNQAQATTTTSTTPTATIDAATPAGDGGNTVVKVEFIPSNHPPTAIILTSCGVDGTIKRWDSRTGAELGCWRGHSDGILGFVQTEKRVVTAGDDYVALVFDIPDKAAGTGAVQGAGRPGLVSRV